MTSVGLTMFVFMSILWIGVYFWYRTKVTSIDKLLDMYKRWKDDSADPFLYCGDLTNHIKRIDEEREQLGKSDIALERFLKAFQRDIDDSVTTLREIDRWLSDRARDVAQRVGCYRKGLSLLDGFAPKPEPGPAPFEELEEEEF